MLVLLSCNVACTGRVSRLATLIEDELAERGQLANFLEQLVPDESQAAVFVPLALQPAQHKQLTSSSKDAGTPLLLPACASGSCSGPASSQSAAEESAALLAVDSPAAMEQSLLQPHAAGETLQPSNAADSKATPDESSSIYASSADVTASADAVGNPVLDAALAAFKREKRQLWKACTTFP